MGVEGSRKRARGFHFGKRVCSVFLLMMPRGPLFEVSASKNHNTDGFWGSEASNNGYLESLGWLWVDAMYLAAWTLRSGASERPHRGKAVGAPLWNVPKAIVLLEPNK